MSMITLTASEFRQLFANNDFLTGTMRIIRNYIPIINIIIAVKINILKNL